MHRPALLKLHRPDPEQPRPLRRLLNGVFLVRDLVTSFRKLLAVRRRIVANEVGRGDRRQQLRARVPRLGRPPHDDPLLPARSYLRAG